MIKGLTEQEIIESRKTYGSNKLNFKEEKIIIKILKDIFAEPMFIILILLSFLYFIIGQINDGFIMLISIVLVVSISLFQEYKSKSAIAAIKKIAQPRVKVRRDDTIQLIADEELVINDIMYISEGEIISADALIISSNDFSVNESILTGESFPVNKSMRDTIYRGTLVISGGSVVQVTAVGKQTLFGKIGTSLELIKTNKSPLELKINKFVKKMIVIGVLTFLLTVYLSYEKSGILISSLLIGLTITMSIFPEEIPVAISTFHAIGAYRLLKNHNIIVKQPKYVETLGESTVICIDKTGTITQNKMHISYLYDFNENKIIDINQGAKSPLALIEYAVWSSEMNPFDPMEKSIHQLYEENITNDKRKIFKQVHEYPLSGKPPIMTHIFKYDNEIIIASKGAPEGILNQTTLDENKKNEILKIVEKFACDGYRILGIGKSIWNERKWPVSQNEFTFEFLGLIMFQDPPKENINETIKTFKDAGVRVVMITGDYKETAISIANKIGLTNDSVCLNGNDVIKMSNQELKENVKHVNIFARMFPEAKLKVVEALKDNGEIVAMTGDGVNDAPALKAADIGISLGRKGSEVAKNAAALVIIDDELYHMTEAIALGRKIYDNLKKSLRYIISIHIPIILIVLLPLLFNWKFSILFFPVHVIFLELIMGPTCSIAYENEPMEPEVMKNKPILQSADFLSLHQMLVSVLQGLIITIGCLVIGYIFIQQGQNEQKTRTIVFSTLMFSNLFLTFINRSPMHYIYETLFIKNNLMLFITFISLLLIFLFLYNPVINQFLKFSFLSIKEIIYCVITAFICTFWIEPFKKLNRNSLSHLYA